MLRAWLWFISLPPWVSDPVSHTHRLKCPASFVCGPPTQHIWILCMDLAPDAYKQSSNSTYFYFQPPHVARQCRKAFSPVTPQQPSFLLGLLLWLWFVFPSMYSKQPLSGSIPQSHWPLPFLPEWLYWILEHGPPFLSRLSIFSPRHRPLGLLYLIPRVWGLLLLRAAPPASLILESRSW